MKIFRGKVISAKMPKTVTVTVERFVVHPLYKKRLKRIKKYQVHDEFNAQEGDNVLFVNSKAYSKLKKWKIVKIIDVSHSSKRKEKETK